MQVLMDDVNKNEKQEIELAIPLKYLCNFWRALNIPLISCEVSLELKWNKNCVITSFEERQVDAGPPVIRDNSPTGAIELKWNKNCVITSLEERQVDAGPPVIRDNSPTGATLAINDCKLYIPVVTLSKHDEIKLLTNLKSGFKREIIWNKYRSQMTTEAINNNLNIL